MSKIATIKAIREILVKKYGYSALKMAKKIYEDSFNQVITIVERRK